MMKIKRVLQPGKPGTKKLSERYGDNLVCVRYRYDDEKMTTFKTIEIIIERKPWQPNIKRIHKNEIMSLHIAYEEVNARNLVKAAGGKWDPKRRVWQLVYEKVRELGMTNRIVDNEV
jgi:hypothetical protein